MELVAGRTIEIGQRVRVYVNLHKQGRFSIVDMKTGLVCCYTTNCLLKDAIFHVSENGRKKVIATKQKMVHAWIRGTYMGGDVNQPPNLMEEVVYNPYRHEGFMNTKGEIVREAEETYCVDKKVFIE